LVVPKRGQGVATATVRLTEPGRYPFECTRMCGAGHNFMRGVLIVRAAGRP
jgi:heme/copper-type cytochrome/quinol oxidase subunit 2